MKIFKSSTCFALLLGATVLCVSSQVGAHGSDAHPVAAPTKAVQQAWGIAAKAKAPARRIEVSMSDAMRFTPSLIEVKLGETIQFIIKNEGQVLHEFVLGTEATLAQHAALMMKFPNMEHDEPYMAHVPPGKTGEISWTFNRAGEFDFACLIAGHYQAGMVGRIKVVKASK
ncbi:cupredoxin family protein [Roseateles sp.]|uniref:cupredoxin domain-containing protein n=1 Tax=Roseateles sp. TaxID=1971397 RepID=UPI00286B710A|nr:cupredoxin family protein [Roseateles sp.]